MEVDLNKRSKTGKLLRNYEISKGIMRYSKSAIFHRRRLFEDGVVHSSRRKADWAKHQQKLKEKTEAEQKKVVKKPIGGEKNGKERVIQKKQPRSISTALKKTNYMKRLNRKKSQIKKFKPLRSSLIPGKILIVLAGPYRGKRVVFLDRLPSGLLLITGPYRLNGCPLRRVHPTRVIATTEHIPGFERSAVFSGIFSGPDQLTESADAERAFFMRRGGGNMKKTKANKVKQEEDIFETADGKKNKEPLPEARKEIQKAIDNRILDLINGAITENPLDSQFLKRYLSLPFALKSGQYPHTMVF